MVLLEAARPQSWPEASAIQEQAPGPLAADPVIVIGGDPAGIRTAQELARCKLPVILFNAEACVNCRNSHGDSPKKDFKLGAVMGAVVIRIPSTN